ncbi:hypothetical protein GS4_14_00620 [Gordonia soli NBRC 108243]|uniref:Uncharacterized protein n=1 Tax=Gordonia soli NBRC 108243 TaxID=1223545 RepID=M0QIV1_9ACTN|nr:hypothetical protein GS4_14_00620 [Gordonia soli NBRC 108243]
MRFGVETVMTSSWSGRDKGVAPQARYGPADPERGANDPRCDTRLRPPGGMGGPETRLMLDMNVYT